MMSSPVLWISVLLMLVGAVMLVAGFGAAALWIAVVTVGIALLIVDQTMRRRHHADS